MLARFLSSAALLGLSAGMASAEFTVNILHINDMHSRIQPISRFDSTCSAEDDAAGECFGGAARVATKLAELRAELEGQNVLVLDAGDQFQGSLFFTTYEGMAAAEVMNAIGFDAMTLGNHEFNLGPAKLAAFVEALDFPVVAGSLDLSRSEELGGNVQDTLVLEVGGERIGIVSAVASDTPELSSPGPNVIFTSEIDAIAADVAALQEQGVDKIIALTHVGLPEDIRIAEAVNGIDAIIGGHSHTYLSASDPDRAGAYPTYATAPDGTLVPIVQAYAYSKYVGHLVLTFDDEGNVMEAGGDTLLLDAAVTPDPQIAARVEELAGPIQEMMTEVVSEASAAIEGSREVCRAMECAMGNLVADAMLDRTAGQGVTIAFQNGGGLRASIDAGEVTMGEVVTVLPFQNTLATFEGTGQMVIDALENGLSQVEEGAGRFPQVAGMTFTWDPSAEPGSRVVEVLVAEGDGFVPIDPEATYGIVTNNFMRNGGDGYAVFRNGMNAYDFGPGLEVVVADYLAANAPYMPYTDGRITAVE
jgi:5'-nucleotidase